VSNIIEVLFDARDLEAPEPLSGALRYAKNLKNDEYVKMIHRMRPCHLFDMLEKMCVWSYDFEDKNEHIIFMAKSDESIAFTKELIKNEYDRIVS